MTEQIEKTKNAAKEYDVSFFVLHTQRDKLYERIYDSARPNNRYLPSDMDESSDPWIKLNL